jgi:protocatechuate 3,4-dioxygenase, alpha subunit
MLPTPSQTVGPFYSIGLCRRSDNVLDENGVEIVGMLYDGQDAPVVDGMIEVWDHEHRLWGRCGTHPDGQFSFLIPADVDHLDTIVFARGLLRHQLTRIYVTGEPPESSMRATQEDGGLRFDIRMQGERATVFFEH